jgi:hypothetical protein
MARYSKGKGMRMEDDRTTEPPPPPSEGERAEAEDTSPEDAPAEPANEPETGGDAETGTDEPTTPAPSRDVNDQIPRTTTTGDDEQDLRGAGDGAVSGVPGDDLDDSTQRHD